MTSAREAAAQILRNFGKVVDVDELDRLEKFLEARDTALLRDERARALENRGIETPCSRCGGSGVRAYANTATWSGSIGGNMITSDVCDHCWGSGDEHRKWVNLRDKQAELARERARVQQALDRIGEQVVPMEVCVGLEMDLARERARQSDTEALLRREVWLRHGHDGLYGDDGEMQCGICGIDFKRLPVPRLVELLSTQDVIRYNKTVDATARLNEVRKRAEEWKEFQEHDCTDTCKCDSECADEVLAILDRKLDAGGSAEPTIEDGFGSVWSKRCPMCGKLRMQVIRPGSAQCSHCG